MSDAIGSQASLQLINDGLVSQSQVCELTHYFNSGISAPLADEVDLINSYISGMFSRPLPKHVFAV